MNIRLPRLTALMLATVLWMLASVAAGAQARNRVLGFTTYDEDYFYVAAIVHKPVVQGQQTAPFADLLAQPLTDDVVAVFLQAPGESGKPPHRVEMAVSAAGGAQLYRGPTAKPLTGFEDFLTAGPDGPRMPFKYGVSKMSDANKVDGGTTGYVVEMAIPWVELGGRPAAGQRLRFNVIAYSAAPASSPMLSLSAAVKTPQDAQNPAKWSEIILVDAPVKSIASAPEAKVSARVFAAKPVIDGVITEGEWNPVTSFEFEEAAGGGTAPSAPTTGAPRFRPKVTLSKPRPVVAIAPRPPRPLAKRVPQAVPRLVLTLYNYEFQADPRKAVPLIPVRREDSSSLLVTHPMGGAGPWLTYDRVDWHREQLENVRRAGIDVILPVYRGGAADRERYATRGLITLAAALEWMRSARLDYPLIGLYLDTTSLAEGTGKLDLRSPAGKARLYAAIKDFFLLIPPAFRANVLLSEPNGGGLANLVVLSSAAPFSDLDSSFVDYCRERFARDFGADLIFLGGGDFKPKATLDGYVTDTRGHGFQMDTSGWIKPASLGIGAAPPAKSATATTHAQDQGDLYRSHWKQALDKKADWVFLDGWNDFREGTEIAPSLEQGIRYSDLTRAYSRGFEAVGPRQATFLTHTIPSTAAAGGSLTATARVMNSGLVSWTPDAFGLSYRWQKGGSSGTPTVVPLPAEIRPGDALTVPVTLTVPTDPGAYTLVIDAAELGKKDEVKAAFGAAPLTVHVQVVSPGASAPAYGVSLVSSDLPATLESGGTYTATVTLRNDGAKTWKTSDGGRIIARVLRHTSPLSGDSPEATEVADMADASVELPHDVAPGHEVTVILPVTFSDADGQRLEPWSPSEDWIYQLRWEVAGGSSATQGAATVPQAIALVDADFGPRFTTDVTPRDLPGDRRIPIPLSIRNDGPQTWRKNAVSIGYHWYYLDGTEVVWQDETTPIPQDVPPGGDVKDLLTWVTAPPNDGSYWLVWDVKVGDSWTSTLPSVRPFETRVQQVNVIRGRLSFVNLDKQYNLDGVSSDEDRTDGDFDGSGRTLPAELVPPLVTTDVAPSTLWLPAKATGLDSPRKISFKWGPKGDKEKNALQCVGQRVPVADSRKAEVCKAVHLLAAATAPNVTAGFTLVFTDGSEQFSSFPFSQWDAPPSYGEEIAFASPRIHTASGEQDKPVHLYHYTIRIAEQKKLAAIVLPSAPAVKVLAITLEK